MSAFHMLYRRPRQEGLAARALVRATVFLLALLLLGGCGTGQPSAAGQATATLPGAPEATPLPTGTATPGAGPTPVTGLLDPAPTNCPVSSPLQMLTQENFGGGFSSPISFLGASPVWQFGLPQGGGTLNLNQNGAEPLPGTKVLWVVGPNYAQPVTLSGQEVRTGAPLWFTVFAPNFRLTSDLQAVPSFTTTATLDPAAPNRGSTDNSTGHWTIFGIGITVVAAGCYQLDVSWPGGSWHAIYAVGR